MNILVKPRKPRNCFVLSHLLAIPLSSINKIDTSIPFSCRFNVESDGVILYAGQNDGLDFISLAFVGQDVILRYGLHIKFARIQQILKKNY